MLICLTKTTKIATLAALSLVGMALRPATALAQLPRCEVWLLKVEQSKDKEWKLVESKRISEEGRYANQPHFVNEGTEVLFTQWSPGGAFYVDSALPWNKEGQTDIMSSVVATGQTRKVANTNEDEFSPKPSPSGAWTGVVQVEKDSTQRLWKMGTMKKPGSEIAPYELVSAKCDSVGYYAWLTDDIFYYAKITTPLSLYMWNVTTDTGFRRCSSIGRCIETVPYKKNASLKNRWVSFIDRTMKTDTCFMIYKLNVYNELERVAPALVGVEDFTWTQDGKLLACQGTSIYQFDTKKKKKGWVKVLSLEDTELSNLYRLAISPDGTHIAVVNYPK